MSDALFTAEGLSGLVFLVMIAITISGALIATNSTRLIRSVTGLSLCFIGVAGLFYFLNSPFIAMMEMLIYVGAVCVAIIFALMLAEPRMEDKPGKQSGIGSFFGFIAAGLVFCGVAGISTRTTWIPAPIKENDGSITEIGKALLTSYSMVFELISVVLLVAIIGALVLARTGRSKNNA